MKSLILVKVFLLSILLLPTSNARATEGTDQAKKRAEQHARDLDRAERELERMQRANEQIDKMIDRRVREINIAQSVTVALLNIEREFKGLKPYPITPKIDVDRSLAKEFLCTDCNGPINASARMEKINKIEQTKFAQ